MNNKLNQRMSLEEISKEIGISRTTIYKVINKKGYVTEETKAKVEAALEKYHYVPNYNARDLARNRKYRIGYVGMIHLSANYFATMTAVGMKRALKEYRDRGLELVIRESDFRKPELQIKHMDELYNLGIRNFIVSVSEGDVIKEKVDELRSKGCTVVYLSRYVEEEKRMFIGPDYIQSGRIAGELMGKFLSGGGKILILLNNDVESDIAVKGRYEGFVQEINRFAKIGILAVEDSINTEQEAIFCVKKYLKKYPDLAGIYDVSYKLTTVAETITECSRKKICLVGFDYYDEVIPYIKNSTVDAVVSQDLVYQAYKAVKIVFEQMCYGRKIPYGDQYAKLDIVMATNVDYCTN